MQTKPIAEFTKVTYQGSLPEHHGAQLWLEYCGCTDCGPDWASGSPRYNLFDDGGRERLHHVRHASVRVA